MKLRNLIPAVGALLALAALAPFGASAQGKLALVNENRELFGVKVGRTANATGSIAMKIKYVGTWSTGGASIAVDDSTGDITVEDDAGTVDTSISTNGVIDVSGPAEDTAGEVCAIFNNDTGGNWACILVDALASDSMNDVLDDLSEIGTGLDDPEGQPLYFDTIEGNCEFISLSIGPAYTDDAVWSVSGATTQTSNDGLLGRVANAKDAITTISGQPGNYRDTVAQLDWTSGTLTGTGTSAVSIYFVERGLPGASTDADVITVVSSYVLDADISDTAAAIGWPSATQPESELLSLRAPPGYSIIVKWQAGTTITSGTAKVHGSFWPQGS